MNTLDIARNGRSAARQIRAQMRAGVLTNAELERLLAKVEEGFEQMMGPHPLDAPAPAVRVLHVYDGGRA
jgi:hypothetical protein